MFCIKSFKYPQFTPKCHQARINRFYFRVAVGPRPSLDVLTVPSFDHVRALHGTLHNGPETWPPSHRPTKTKEPGEATATPQQQTHAPESPNPATPTHASDQSFLASQPPHLKPPALNLEVNSKPRISQGIFCHVICLMLGSVFWSP